MESCTLMSATRALDTFDVPGRLRFSRRMLLVGLTVALVLGAAALTAETAADQVRDTSTLEAAQSAESVVRSFVDPLLTESALEGPGGTAGRAIDTMLERLVESGYLLRIKVWGHDGTVLFSDLPELRGQRFDVEGDLAQALGGEVAGELSHGTAAENVFETGLASRFLEVYVPVRSTDTGEVLAAYEIYQDASSIDASVAATRLQVFLIAAILAVLLLVAFEGASRHLGRQNRRLRELAGTLADNEARFRFARTSTSASRSPVRSTRMTPRASPAPSPRSPTNRATTSSVRPASLTSTAGGWSSTGPPGTCWRTRPSVGSSSTPTT